MNKLQYDQPLGKPKLIQLKGLNLGVTATQLRIHDQYLRDFATLQRFEKGESRQNTLRLQMIHKNYLAKYTFDDIIGDSPTVCRARDILHSAWDATTLI